MKRLFTVLFFLILFTAGVVIFKQNLLNMRFPMLSWPLGNSEPVNPLAKQDPVKDIETLLREKGIDTVASPIASDSAIFVILSSGDTHVLFDLKKDPILQVNSLQIILNKLTIEGRKAQKIDFRFGDPIVVY